MAWPLRHITGHDEHYEIIRDHGLLASIGCWWWMTRVEGGKETRMVCVVLPPGGNNGWFNPQRVYPGDQSWTESGSWAQGTVTVQPSINLPGQYHGYIQNGQITDDCEGRTYRAAGKCVEIVSPDGSVKRVGREE